MSEILSRARKRTCLDCPADISHRYRSAKRCEPCATKKNRRDHNAANRRLLAKHKNQALEKGYIPYAISPILDTQKEALGAILSLHQTIRLCRIDHCHEVIAHVERGLCNTHNERWKRGIRGEKLGKPIRRQYAEKVKCRINACAKFVTPYSSHGLCVSHRVRQKKGKDLNTPLKVFKPLPDHCEHPGCTKPRSGHARLCGMHGNRKKNGLDMDAPVGAFKKYYKVKCAHPPCDLQAIDIGYCRFHGKRKRNGVDLFKEYQPRLTGGCRWINPDGVLCGKNVKLKDYARCTGVVRRRVRT